MAKKKLTDAEVLALRADYEAWNPHDPDSISAEELAKRHGISKQTLYSYRDRWIADDRRQREQRERENHDGDHTGQTAEAVVFLASELARAQTIIGELRRELDEARIERAGLTSRISALEEQVGSGH